MMPANDNAGFAVTGSMMLTGGVVAGFFPQGQSDSAAATPHIITIARHPGASGRELAAGGVRHAAMVSVVGVRPSCGSLRLISDTAGQR